MGLAEMGPSLAGREPLRSELGQIDGAHGIDLHAQHLFEPSGGDLFDTVRVGTRVAFLLSDIAGRRPEVDAISAEMRRVFRASATGLLSAADVNLMEATETLILAINQALIGMAKGVRFAPTMVGCYDVQLGVLAYINAGGQTALFQDSEGTRALPNVAVPLGLFTHLPYDASMQAFEPGARLLVVTKGVTESRGRKNSFGAERVMEVLRGAREESASGMCRAVLKGAQGFEKRRWGWVPFRGGTTREDMTALAMVRRAREEKQIPFGNDKVEGEGMTKKKSGGNGLLIKLFFVAVCGCSVGAAGQGASAAESGVFLLHKFAKEIGKETYAVTADAKGTRLASEFLFTDRGSPVPMKTAFEAGPGLMPISLTEKGRYSRQSAADDSFAVKDGVLTVTHDGKTSRQAVPGQFFLMDGYSPVAMQQEMMRFWLGHGRPESVATPPTGAVRIAASGPLTVQMGGKAVKLTGYTVSGLIWGVESLWMDDRQELVALVSTDAEFDHFEAVREAYEGSLATFIGAAAKDDLAALAKLAAKAKLAPAKVLAITGATLIDGNGGAPVTDATVVLTGDTITAVGPAKDVKIPQGAAVLDAKGKTIIPGLWDMHAHYEQVEWGPIYLAAGVTTVRDCGNEFDFITTARDAIRNGTGIGPEILMAGIVDGLGPISLGAVTATTPEEAIAVVHRYHDAGALQIKIYSSVKPEIVPVITAEAHRLGMTVTGHVPNGMTTVQAVEAGMDQINHIQYPARDLLNRSKENPMPPVDFSTDAAKAQIAVFQAKHTVFDPTMSLFEWATHTDEHPVASFEPGISHVAPQLVAALDTPGVPVKDAKGPTYLYGAFLATLRELHKDGLDIVAGTDQNIPGYSLHREMEIYVQAGFTPMEALQAATTVPARVMGLSKTMGSVEAGKRADLVILDADPLADIANTRKVYKTIAAGAVYDPGPLWESVEFRP